MKDALLLLILLTILFILLLLGRKKANGKKLKSIRELAGKRKNEYFNFAKIALYLSFNKEKYFHLLSDQTISDIDLLEAFKAVDFTSSKVGQQFLFDKLCKPTNDIAALRMMQQQADYFKSNAAKREQAQMLLGKLNDEDAYYITQLLADKLVEKPDWIIALYLNNILLVLLLLFSIKFPVLLLFIAIPVAVNIFVSLRNKNNTSNFSSSLPQLDLLVKVAKKLEQLDLPFDSKNAQIAVNELKSFCKRVKILSFSNPTGTLSDIGQIGFMINEMLKTFFAIEVFAFYKLIKDLENKKYAIQTLIKYIGEVDVSITVAVLQTIRKKSCTPIFLSNEKQLTAQGAYHPLIDDCVENDFLLRQKSILITGSNMSGKTTFLRTIALNTVFAQTLHTCFAATFCLPILRLYSSIRIDDSVLEGKSYYFEEVNVISSLVEAADQEVQCLFVLDEVFKGTNTVERVALGKSILSYLNRKTNMVLVSTHDLELNDLLRDEYELYHFTETIKEDQLYFDHQLKLGKLTSTNAIRILELTNFPRKIIEEATAIKNQLQRS